MTARPRLIAIGSGKGGTGKTLIAISLAQALADAGERVLLCDADLGLANAAVHLGQTQSGDLAALLGGLKPLPRCVAATACGFDLLAAPSGSGALANAGPLAAESLIVKLRAAAGYSIVLIDLGAGVDDGVMGFATAADETILVMTPDPASLTDAYAFAKLHLKGTGTRLPRVIVNMAASESEAARTREAMAATCKAFLRQIPLMLGTIPLDRAAQDAVRRQRPLLSVLPHGPAAKAVIKLAAGLAAPRPGLRLAAVR